MIAWWQSLSGLEHALLYLAIPATLILLLQTLLLLLGGDADGHLEAGGAEGDLDGGDPGNLDGEGLPDGNLAEGLNIFTLRGFVAFFTLFGWGGLWLLQLNVPTLLALFLAVQMGIAGMVGIALVLRAALRLQSDGTVRIGNAVGLDGVVYLTVPPNGAGTGKVNVTIQERLCEIEAVTREEDPLPTGTPVEIIGTEGPDTLLVRRKKQAT